MAKRLQNGCWRGAAFGLALVLAAQPVAAQQAQPEQPAREAVTVTSEGVVEAARAWDVTPKTSNLIRRLHFTEGQRVAKGDLLVEMDTGFKQLEVDLARAERDRARIVLQTTQEDLARQEKLKEREAVSLKAYQDAYYAVETAKADLRIAEVQLEMAEAVLEVQKIHAPFDGRITAPRYRENAYVDLTEGTEIATIVQLDPINVRSTISVERLLTRLRAGEFGRDFAKRIKVELKLSDGLVYRHYGTIVSTGVGIDPETGLGSVLVSFPNPDGILRPGLPVRLTGLRK